MFKKSDNFSYDIDQSFDFILEEKANKFTALRKIRWGDSGDYKLDIRNYVATNDGERMLKGCTFISDTGVHELTDVLLSQGYGYPEKIIETLTTSRMDIIGGLAAKFKDDPAYMDKCAESYTASADTYYDLAEVLDVSA